MARTKRFPHRRVIPLSLQDSALRTRFPTFKVLERSHKKISWLGSVQPSDLCEVYLVKIEYSQSKFAPKVWVLSPNLNKRNQEKIPHLYPEGDLCLYLPGTGEWSRDQLIADTFIPWASLWLYYYEMWHATGKWLGGGVHNEGGKKSDA